MKKLGYVTRGCCAAGNPAGVTRVSLMRPPKTLRRCAFFFASLPVAPPRSPHAMSQKMAVTVAASLMHRPPRFTGLHSVIYLFMCSLPPFFSTLLHFDFLSPPKQMAHIALDMILPQVWRLLLYAYPAYVHRTAQFFLLVIFVHCLRRAVHPQASASVCCLQKILLRRRKAIPGVGSAKAGGKRDADACGRAVVQGVRLDRGRRIHAPHYRIYYRRNR